MPPAGSPQANWEEHQEGMEYRSRDIAYQAVGMVTSIIEKLLQYNEICYMPAFVVYSLFLVLDIYISIRYGRLTGGLTRPLSRECRYA